MKAVKDENGTIIVMVILMLTALVAMIALAFDFGSWYQAHRNLQAAADAGVLAGAQDLPDTATASSTATSYVNANTSGLDSGPAPTFPDTSTIDITLTKTVPGAFSQLVGITSKTISAHARAVVGTPGSAKNIVPIGIKSTVCPGGSSGWTSACYNVARTLSFDDTNTTTFGSNSTFGLLDLVDSSANSSSCNGNIGESIQAQQINGGYSGTISVNRYYGATTGQRTSLRNALNNVIGQVLLVPVFDQANLTWCNAGGFHVVGWGAFVVDQTIPNSDWNPHTKILHGHFVQFIDHDVTLTPGVPSFGVKVIQLTQ
jgi:hypothetical protein